MADDVVVPGSVLSTHVTVVHRPGRAVAEVLPGIFVIDSGAVRSAAVAGHLFEPTSRRVRFAITENQRAHIERIVRSRAVTTA